VKDASGKPLADAEAALVVVDEAILTLAGHHFSDPIGAFYPHRGPDTRDYYQRAYVKLAGPDVTRLAANDPGDAGYMGGPGGGAATGVAMPTAAAPMEAEADMMVRADMP